MKPIPCLLVAAILSLLTLPAFANTAELINAKDLAALMAKDEVRLLDVQEEPSFLQHRLPGAVNIPYSRWRTSEEQQGEVVGNLLPIADLERLLGKAGIAPDDHVVVVATGLQPGDLSAMARVFWTLKLLGHQRVSLLNGGLADYAGQRLGPLVRGQPEAVKPVNYKATPDLGLLASAADLSAGDLKAAQTIDARSPAEFLGLITGGADERAGTIPGAVNLPFNWLALDGGGKLRSADALKSLFGKAGVEARDGSVHFCHTGNRASLTWFVDYAVMGNRNARLYDASMLEWARNPELPMDPKWTLD